jgi:hypothetical protein
MAFGQFFNKQYNDLDGKINDLKIYLKIIRNLLANQRKICYNIRVRSSLLSESFKRLLKGSANKILPIKSARGTSPMTADNLLCE